MNHTAMVFAAGKGKRMLPLTLDRPKPLLELGGRSLLAHLLYKLEAAGIRQAVVNAAYLSKQIVSAVENMHFSTMQCALSVEDEPLETGGALVHALPLLGEAHFILCNGDVWSDYPLDRLVKRAFSKSICAHLILVPNPEHNPSGDFALLADGRVVNRTDAPSTPSYTFSGISVIHPSLVRDYAGAKSQFPMRELLNRAIEDGRVSGELYLGLWLDIGTPERWQRLQSMHNSV